jgi:hypothetical protein
MKEIGVWHLVAAIQADAAKWIIISCAVIALMVIVGGVVVWYYRKWVLFSDPSPEATVWTFDDLRRMKEQGELSEEEYQSLRAAMIGAYQGKLKSSPPETEPREQPGAAGEQ